VLPALAVLLPFLALIAVPTPGPSERDVVVAVVQGNVPRLGLDFNAQRRAVLDNHVRRTEQLAADVASGREPRPDLVIWPENSSDIDPYRNPDAATLISRAATAINAPIAVGAVLSPAPLTDGGPVLRTRNTVIVWTPTTGPDQTYTKRHLQPFGEYIPWRGLVRLFSSEVDRVSWEFQPGDRPGVLRMGPATVGVATCYEVAFDYVFADVVDQGAQLLAVPTNNATEMTYQQLAMSRVRAVEHDRAVLVAATSGVSAVIDPDGRVRRDTRMFTSDALVATAPLRQTATLATQLGAVPEWIITGAGLLALVAALREPLARRVRGATRHDHKRRIWTA
jgi:apolipoprotein N-acyltransferase